MKVLLNGRAGKVGLVLGPGLEAAGHTLVDELGEADAMVDFTQPDAVAANVRAAVAAGVPSVVGTTGWDTTEFADAPVTVFEEGTADGDSVFAMIRHNEHVQSSDVDRDPPPGWHGSAEHGYRSFVAVPVVAGQTPYGMLTVDAMNAGGVGPSEVPFVRLLAGLLADALAYGTVEEGLRRLVR